MKVLIIEDETPAAEKLERYLTRLDEPIEVLAILQSVKDSVEWFKANPDYTDLVFMDIQLSDGKSFEIFEKTQVKAPIIFTTAYDEYAIEAFKVNGIADQGPFNIPKTLKEYQLVQPGESVQKILGAPKGDRPDGLAARPGHRICGLR